MKFVEVGGSGLQMARTLLHVMNPCANKLKGISFLTCSGYKKFKPWNSEPAVAGPPVPTSFSSSPDISLNDKPELRWALFGPHINKYVLYQSAALAYMMSDDISDKLARALRISDGIRLVRGWDEVQKLKSKSPSPSKGKQGEEDAEAPAKELLPESKSPEVNAAESKLDDSKSPNVEKKTASMSHESLAESVSSDIVDSGGDREIKHLIFVVHGIGQKSLN